MKQTIRCSADGAHGQHGARGADGSDGTFAGANGGHGGHAGASTPGAHAGRAEVTLVSSASSPDVPVGVVHIRSSVNRAEQMNGPIAFAQFESVDISARGGNGGAGGTGGDGGHGAQGSRGRDATRYSSGGDGGPGGDGGDGGRGSHGSAGGDGGNVRVVVDARDTYLLMAVDDSAAPEQRVRGGDGGAAGRHGSGGAGGAGGRGGSSHTWFETVTERNGDTTTTRTITHYSPGGSDGPSGSRGSTPSFPLHPGANGNHGVFEIVVADKTYPRRYDLALASFKLVETNPETHDGIFEPGEIVGATEFRFANVGRMPTPRHQRIRTTLARGDLVQPLPDEGFIAVSLDEGEVGRVDDLLRFQIREQVIDASGDPLVLQEEVGVVAEQLGVEVQQTSGADSHFVRRYTGAGMHTTRTLTTRFPVCNHGDVRVLRSLAPGERSRVLFDVHNVSTRDLGRASKSGRVVAVHLTWEGGEVEPGDVTYVDASGTKHDFEISHGTRAGYYAEIPLIEAGGRVVIEGVIGVSKKAAAYAAARMRYALLIEHLDKLGTGELRVAQLRDFTIRVEPGYRREDDTRVLLVTTDATRQEMHREWHRFLEHDLGLPADDWSLTRYGHFDLRVPLDDGTDLYTHLEDKLVIVLNDPFHPRSDPVQEAPAAYVRSTDFRVGATANGTHVLAVGAAPFDVGALLQPATEVRHGGDDMDTVAQLYAKERKSTGTLAEEMFKDDLTRNYDVVKVTKTFAPFFRPKVNQLHLATRHIEAKLRSLSPHKRHVLVMRPHETPKMVGRTLGIFPRYELGTVEVRRTLDRDTPAAVVLTVDGASVADVGTQAADACRFAALLALPFTDKLSVLERFLRRAGTDADRVAEEVGPLLVDAMLSDIAHEVHAALERASLDDDAALENALPSFMRLTRFALPSTEGSTLRQLHHTPQGRMMLSLAGGLLALADMQSPWWRIAGKKARLAAFLRERSQTFAGITFGGGALIEPGNVGSTPAAALLARIVAQHRKHAEAHGAAVHVNERAASVDILRRPARCEIAPLQRDCDVLLEPSARIWSELELAHHQAVENARLTAQKELRERNKADRAAMLVATKNAATTDVATGQREVTVADSVTHERVVLGPAPSPR